MTRLLLRSLTWLVAPLMFLGGCGNSFSNEATLGDTAERALNACPALPTSGLFAQFDVFGESFSVAITNPTGIDQAIDLWNGKSTAIVPMGDLLCKPEGFNCPYTWHLDPATVRFADASIEVCDGTPSYIEANCATFGPVYCPWAAQLKSLRDCRTDPTCPEVPRSK